MQPGSVMNGNVTCDRVRCKRRSEQASKMKHVCKVFAESTRATECRSCRIERFRRQLVANIASDYRFISDAFRNITAVFANNDIKYAANKLRAQTYAQRQREGLIYCPGKDTPSTEALRLRPDLPALKISWLNRHDRDSGDLYGMLPLMIPVGMPVAVSEHINRSYVIRILKGRIGYIHSWILDAEDKSEYEDGVRVLHTLPMVVFVKFYTKDKKEEKLRLPGLKENAAYPITPRTSTWFLDNRRNFRLLRIARRQLPLTPAWAMTSHSA